MSAPADLPVSRDLPLRLLVDSRGTTGGTTGLLVQTRAELDLATFPTTLWDDDFSTDRTGEYAVDVAAGEAPPTLSVADGALTATATSRSFGLLQSPVDAGERVAVVVEPRSFAGTGALEDSLFTGLAAGPGNYALGWYNHSRAATGTNVVVDGRGRPDAEGGSGPTTRWVPGDRFAAVVEQGRMTTWHEHDGQWSRLTSSPVTSAVPAEELAGWAPAVGLRLDPGSISLDRLTVFGKTA